MKKWIIAFILLAVAVLLLFIGYNYISSQEPETEALVVAFYENPHYFLRMNKVNIRVRLLIFGSFGLKKLGSR